MSPNVSPSVAAQKSPRALRALLSERKIERVVVLGANGVMGYGSAALFTSAVPRVHFLARTREKAEQGIAAAVAQVRSSSLASRALAGSYDELESALAGADLIFEALTEDFALKSAMFDRVEKARDENAIVATVTSGLSINELCEGRAENFRRNFLGLHFFNPPNVITGTELIAGADTDPALLDFMEAFARIRLGRDVVRTADTPAFAGNRVGFKVLNEAAALAEEHGPLLVDRLVGPYTGRALTPLATIDLVGWDIHRAIVDGIYEKTKDEAHATLALPDFMAKLLAAGTLGDKSGAGFFRRDGKARLVLDVARGAYRPAEEVALPKLEYIDAVAKLHAQGRYKEGLAVFLNAPGEHAAIARRVMAGYLSYAFHRVGEVCESLDGIDRIMATGFNWAPPGALVDLMGARAALALIESAHLPVPPALVAAVRAAPANGVASERFFSHPTLNVGKFFVAA